MGVGSGDCQSELAPGHQPESAPVREEASTLTARKAGTQPQRHNPGLYLIPSQTQGYPLVDFRTQTGFLRLGELLRGSSEALTVRACVTKVDQQKEGLEGAPGHLLQAAFLMASVSHFSISSPQTTASHAQASVSAISTSVPRIWHRTGLGTPTGPGLPQKRG